MKVALLRKNILPKCVRHQSSKYASRNNKPARKTFGDVMEENREIASRCLVVTQLSPGQLDLPGIERRWTFERSGRYKTLIQFNNYDSIKKVLGNVKHFSSTSVPISSRFLFDQFSRPSKPVHRTLEVDEAKVFQELQGATDVSEQIQMLHLRTQMSELHLRLRFFLCYSLEEILSGLFERCEIVPFGSAVSGLGRYNCDLDMSMTFNARHGMPNSSEMKRKFGPTELMFQSKQRKDPDASHRHMGDDVDVVGGLLRCYVPEIHNVVSVRHARVPIIRFTNVCTEVQCDMSFCNRISYYMGELLWMFGQISPVFRPLVFTVRSWAQTRSLTAGANDVKNRMTSISNYMLTLLVIHFLQTRKVRILPTVKHLSKLAGPNDVKTISEEGHSFRFVSDCNRVRMDKNKESLGTLLEEFFRYYGDANLQEEGVCVVSGAMVQKPEEFRDAPLYLVNPLHPELNAGRIVKAESVTQFQAECRAAVQHLITTTNKEGQREGTQNSWGILGLCGPRSADADKTTAPEVGAALQQPRFYTTTQNTGEPGGDVTDTESDVTGQSSEETKENSDVMMENSDVMKENSHVTDQISQDAKQGLFRRKQKTFDKERSHQSESLGAKL